MKKKQDNQEYIGPHQITYLPLRISATFALPVKAWRLAPGLCLQPISGQIKEELIARESKVKPSSGINSNYVVKIDSIAYGNHLLAKLAKKSKTIPIYPEDIDIVGCDVINITKMILISFILQNDLKFAFAHAHGFKVMPSGIYDKTFSSLNPHPREEMSYTWWSALPRRPSTFINRKVLLKTLDRIEPYYRPFTWEVNRISTALCYFWNSLVLNEPNQLFTNLAILLECLLSTDKQELKHKICERAAILLGKNAEDRLAIYKDVKTIYDQRSRIVHGEGAPKKGQLHPGKFMITPKYTYCPKNLISKVIGISIDLLNVLLKDNEYMSIVRSEKNTNEALNDLFMKRLFVCN